MKIHLYTPVYSATLLLSAALLFSIQPMFSKMILPLLGGAPQVWNTAMMFFQIMLLAGYAYAHATSHFLGIRAQAVLHVVLLAIFSLALPLGIPAGWAPPADHDPTLWQLSLMLVTVGGPFFILAGSAPMLQRWFANADHPDAQDPYFLYGASNLGSMTALLAYPVLVEPLWTLDEQSEGWSVFYYALIAFILCSAALVWRRPLFKPTQVKAANDEFISWGRRLKWLTLAFIPSSLMLGVTTFITTDIASVPLLWVAPLALYLGTFIIVFARTPLIQKRQAALILGFLMIALVAQMILFRPAPLYLVMFHMTLFFFCALNCHLELASSKPRAAHLTEFYLLMATGGALGGIFNAVIAPQFFVIPLEYALALGAACLMRFSSRNERLPKLLSVDTTMATAAILLIAAGFYINRPEHIHLTGILSFGAAVCLATLIERRWIFALVVCLALALFPPGQIWGTSLFKKVIFQDRSFFGVLKVIDTTTEQRILLHGTTNHGAQALDPRYKMLPLSYYSFQSPLNDAFALLDESKDQLSIGVIGLGAGAMACYLPKKSHFDFYEIDPKVAAIAENKNYFTFLSDCGNPYRIILGDGRLAIRNAPDHSYDMIVIDAFGSDNIPIHLLTREAIALYLRKLKPDGILTFNISNNFLDLEPVLANAAQALNISAYGRFSKGGTLKESGLEYYQADWLVMTNKNSYINTLRAHGWTPAQFRKGVHLWTDKYSNIVSVFGNETTRQRLLQILRDEKAKPDKAGEDSK